MSVFHCMFMSECVKITAEQMVVGVWICVSDILCIVPVCTYVPCP